MNETIRGAVWGLAIAAAGVGVWAGVIDRDEETAEAAVVVAESTEAEEAAAHEYAPIEALDLEEALADEPEILAKTLALADFTGRSLDGREVDARSLVEEYPVVLFTYVAEWCSNCRYEAPHLARFYWKYAHRGFRVVARAEYSHPDVTREMAGQFGSPYPIIQGSLNPDPENEDAVRTTTHHFALRKALDDPRKWGTPTNFIVVDGDVSNVYSVFGEFIPEELDAFLDEHLPAAGESGTVATRYEGAAAAD